ncbi:MAG: hypothetical protein DCC43_00570 [Candidatus Brocadia sp.]|nr:hypothetical protein [Candidatus Brocadia fulgida]MCC6325481.1 alpha/beta hydrolase [Candidatus Brocadia sp.]MCE7910195.1 alpha/beta hydrolase [Candidatus Brocadia sp. AMX3]OQZ03160.1 MAG: hypothetical protein B6D35_00245 [Candidatus Brocadia sp. UTAMX2]MDG5996842.1 alpha/beta hydrolase [Candidatus Brocadia sp.]
MSHIYSTKNPGSQYTEKPVFIQTRNYDIFGILHIPDTSSSRDKVVVILLTGASIPRTHRNRMWVILARQLAESGFFSFRFDYRGLGESTGLFEDVSIDKVLSQDLLHIINFLTNLINPGKIILVGECFGARTALSMVNLIKFHGLVFLAAPTINNTERVTHQAGRKDITHYINKLKWQRWGTFLNTERIKRNFIFFIKRIHNKWAGINTNLLISESFSNQLSTLVKKGIPSLMIYGTRDEFYENMKLFLQKIDSEKLKNAEFYEIQGEKAHGLVVDVGVQESIIAKILDWIVSRY